MNRLLGLIVGFALILPLLAIKEDVDHNTQALEFHLESDSVYEEFEQVTDSKVETLLLKVFVVIDFSLYKRWLELEGNDKNKAIANIRYFYAHMIDGISKRFSSIDTGPYRYKCTLSGYYVIQTIRESYFTESEDVKTSNPKWRRFTEVLKKLKTWVAERTDVAKNVGVVAAFTTYRDDAAAGMAYVKTACTSHAVSITQSGPMYSTVGLAAHEIGHNVGAHHDGEGNKCDQEDLYIMTPNQKPSNHSKYHTFSPCSRKYFADYVSSLERSVKNKCFQVKATPVDDEVKKYLSELPGRRYTPDQSCQKLYGLKSYNCMGGSNVHLRICHEIHCYDPIEGRCFGLSELRALDGTPCGNKTWCMNKRCVYDERAPINKGYCLFGDRKHYVTYNNRKVFCSDLLKEPSLCYREILLELCCKTCADLEDKESSDCKYGDKTQGLVFSNMRLTCADLRAQPEHCKHESFRKVCCRTCKEVLTNSNKITGNKKTGGKNKNWPRKRRQG